MSDRHSGLLHDPQPKPDADLPPTPREAELLRRIKELEAKKAQLRDLADPLFDAAQHVHRDGGRVTRGEER